jgi:hypothetical protein
MRAARLGGLRRVENGIHSLQHTTSSGVHGRQSDLSREVATTMGSSAAVFTCSGTPSGVSDNDFLVRGF